jgi:membrane-bound lytic murein transglycosylase D
MMSSVSHYTLLIAAMFTVQFSLANSAMRNRIEINKLVSDSAIDPTKEFSNLFEKTNVGGVSGIRLNPMAVSFVESYMAKHGSYLQRMKGWGKPYFDMMDQILLSNNIPVSLKYLAVIESGLQTSAVSWVGAVGPWQFMPATGRRYGLTVTPNYDERMDFIKSTQAAAKYLKDLFDKYQDWLLVVAAYNCGPGNVERAIARSKSRNFWTLQRFLPEESMNHVKKFIATHYVFEGEGGVTTITKDEREKLEANPYAVLREEEVRNSSTELIKGRYQLEVILKYTGLDKKEFLKYNPNFSSQIALKGEYNLRMPSTCMPLFLSNKYQILEESMQLLLQQAK